jgi:hypothetical protein
MLIDQVAVHLAASKNPEYRQRVLDRFDVLVEVMDSNRWLNEGVKDRFSTERESFELHSDDLTTDGMSFIRGNYDSWLRSLDRPSSQDSSGDARKLLENRAAKHKKRAEPGATGQPATRSVSK